MSNKCILIADDRERKVADAGLNACFKRITVGDYVVLGPAENDYPVIAVIERKSLEDYAASITDGRHDNREKMMALRATTGCAVIYIVEGLAPKDHSTKYGSGIAYSSIESSMFHLMVRDNITVWRTNHVYDTAATLTRFLASMEKLKSFDQFKSPWTQDGKHSVIGGDDGADINLTPKDAAAAVLDVLTATRAKPDDEILDNMWACLSGLSTVKARLYNKKWTIEDIARGRLPADKLVVVTVNDGKDLTTKQEEVRLMAGPKKAKNERLVARPIRASIETFSLETQAAILAKIPSVSVRGAAQLGTILSILDDPKLEDRPYGNIKVGKVRAAKIRMFLTKTNA